VVCIVVYHKHSIPWEQSSGFHKIDQLLRKFLESVQFVRKLRAAPTECRTWHTSVCTGFGISTISNTGIGHLGPLQYKENGELKKASVCLFMCMVTRAIHLEMVTNMTTDAVLTVSVVSWPAETLRNKLYQKGLSGASLYSLLRGWAGSMKDWLVLKKIYAKSNR